MAVPAQPSIDAKTDPSTRSGDRAKMDAGLNLIHDVLAGAAHVRSKGKVYLPKYEGESNTEYARRVESAPWRPVFEDILGTLTAKPFEEEVALAGDKVPQPVKDMVEDVDGCGNNITQFSKSYFTSAVAAGVSLLFVDFPTIGENVSVQEERALGARPYWVVIPAIDVVSLQTAYEGTREVVTHLRYRECAVKMDGFAEVEVERIREYNPGEWKVWEQDLRTRKWSVAVDDRGLELRGPIKRGRKGVTSIPVVPLFTGTRSGPLRVKPPLLDIADMQIELYRALSREDEVLTFAGSPILTGNGLSPPKGQNGKAAEPLVVGPKTVLYAPSSAHGGQPSWDYINPNPQNIEQIRAKVKDISDEMRRLGKQPLVVNTGRPTATGQSIDAARAHSAVKAWALRLKDVLEQALVFTCEYMNLDDTVEVTVYTDFDVMPFAQAPLRALDDGRKRKDISQRTYWEGLRRFDVLPQDFDADNEELLLAEELQGLEPEPVDDDPDDPVDPPEPDDPEGA